MPCVQVEVERSLPRFAGDACAPRLAELLRRCLRLRAEMAHFNINLQYYINLEVLECECCCCMPAQGMVQTA